MNYNNLFQKTDKIIIYSIACYSYLDIKNIEKFEKSVLNKCARALFSFEEKFII